MCILTDSSDSNNLLSFQFPVILYLVDNSVYTKTI